MLRQADSRSYTPELLPLAIPVWTDIESNGDLQIRTDKHGYAKCCWPERAIFCPLWSVSSRLTRPNPARRNRKRPWQVCYRKLAEIVIMCTSNITERYRSTRDFCVFGRTEGLGNTFIWPLDPSWHHLRISSKYFLTVWYLDLWISDRFDWQAFPLRCDVMVVVSYHCAWLRKH